MKQKAGGCVVVVVVVGGGVCLEHLHVSMFARLLCYYYYIQESLTSNP